MSTRICFSLEDSRLSLCKLSQAWVKDPRSPGNHRPTWTRQGPPRFLSSKQGNFQGQCPPVSDGCGNEYEPWWNHLPWAPKTMDNKGFGHLRTMLFTIKTSKNGRFWGLKVYMNVMYLELWNPRNLCCNTRRTEDKGLRRVGRQSSNTEILTLVEDGSWRWFRLENFQVISGLKGNTSRKEASKITQEMFFYIFLQVIVLLQELGNNNFVSCNLKCPSVDPSKGMESSWKAAGMPGHNTVCYMYIYI